MGAVQAGAVEQLVELVALRGAYDLLERDQIGRQLAQTAVEQRHPAKISLVVLGVDRQDSKSRHPCRLYQEPRLRLQTGQPRGARGA